MFLAEPALECLTSCKTGSEIEVRGLRLAAWNRLLDAEFGVSKVDAVGLAENTVREFKVSTEIY
jgi:hypothetical protein